MKFNVLYIIDRMGPGGTEKQLAELIGGLSAGDAVRPHLCTLRPSCGLFDTIDCPKINLGTRRLLSLGTLGKLKRLARFCDDHDIHLVQTFFQDPSLIGAMLKRLRPVKLVISFRDLGFWRTRVENFKMRLAYTQADGFIANSMAVKKHFVAEDDLPPEKIEVICNGFDLNRLEDLHGKRNKGGPPEVGIVANLNRPVKRVQDFISAAALVREKFPDAVFTVIGDGHLRPELEHLAESLGLGQAITFTGSLKDPLKNIVNFSVGIITSETEGFSNAIIEYMACGVPVVATAAGGNPELVVEGENGFLVPVGDVESLADRIIKLLDEKLNHRIGQNNRERISKHLSMPVMVERHENFYREMLSGSLLQAPSPGGSL
jgi:glycosyltransferase involved in cell wall biosynthesis